jgi:hypothetical protein
MHYSLPVLPDKDVQIYVVGHHFMTKIIPRALVEILLLVRSVSDPEQSWIGSFFFFFFFSFFFFFEEERALLITYPLRVRSVSLEWTRNNSLFSRLVQIYETIQLGIIPGLYS